MSWLYSAIVGGGPQDVAAARPFAAVPSEPPPSYESFAVSPPGPAKTKVALSRGPLDLPVLNLLCNGRFVLASASPRRQQLLAHVSGPNTQSPFEASCLPV